MSGRIHRDTPDRAISDLKLCINSAERSKPPISRITRIFLQAVNSQCEIVFSVKSVSSVVVCFRLLNCYEIASYFGFRSSNLFEI
jgi:hypothetical protein